MATYSFTQYKPQYPLHDSGCAAALLCRHGWHMPPLANIFIGAHLTAAASRLCRTALPADWADDPLNCTALRARVRLTRQMHCLI